MANITNEAALRSFSKTFARAVEIEKGQLFVRHPFTSTSVTVGADGKLVDLTKESDYQKWLEGLDALIDRVPVDSLFSSYINDAWRLTWLKYAKSHLSEKDFSEFLGLALVSAENPNMDVNVKIPTLIQWFRKADKKALMDAEDYKVWESLPDTVTLYRGVSVGRERYGLSWTDNRKKAEWFMHRFEREGRSGTLLTVTVPRELCLCYFNSRGEEEVVLDVRAAKPYIEEILI